MKFPKIRLLVAVAVLAMIAAACGGGDTADDTTDATPSVTNPRPGTTTAAPGTTAATPSTTAPAGTTTPAPPGDGTELTIGALDNEGFTRDTLQAPVGEITVTFENKDLSTGEPHNWHVVVGTDEWATLIAEAPDTQSVTFTVDAPGEYQFFCDTHLETMKGKLVVAP